MAEGFKLALKTRIKDDESWQKSHNKDTKTY